MRTGGGDRSGFALLLVVLLLFAIAVAGATGYQVVSSEFAMSTQSREGVEALALARGGLQRFLAEQVGTVGDSVSYAIGDGIATVTTRKLFEQDSLNHLYYIRSEGTVTDLRNPDAPARRVVGAYGWHRMRPVPHKAAIMISDGNIRFRTFSRADGYDQATTSDCAAGGTAGVAGVIGTGNISDNGGGTIQGNPDDDTYPNTQAVIDSAGIRWDILSDPNFPVEFDGSPPDFGSLPSDSFPVVRYVGNLNADWTWAGRGVLIVTGQLQMRTGFIWQGIILAGEISGTTFQFPFVRGTIIGGLNGSNSDTEFQSGYFRYHSCNVYAANESLSYLEVVDNSTFEAN